MPQSKKASLPSKHARSIQRLAVAGLLAGATAACSSDTMRFGDNPFGNPFTQAKTADTTTTGSIGYSPTPPVYSTPLAPPQAVQAAVQSAPRPSVPQSASAAVEAVGGTAKGWSSQGGSAVYVGSADTLASLSGRYNVPSAAILTANGLASASDIRPGQQIVIPVYNSGGALPTATASAAAAASAPLTQAATTAAAPVRNAAASVTHAAAQPVQRAQAAAGSLNDQAAKLAHPNPPMAAPPARQVVASLPPVTATDAVKSPVAPPRAAAAPVPATAAAAAAAAPVASVPAAPQAAAKPEPAKEEPKVEANSSGFRWPARGRVINGFGNGNEGINIAVPEGTPIKAAEGGVVAYAGSELKGYGNLVLIRHDNGWVSAYANNADLKVKRGDKVSRGQTIANSGQTGNVTSPQLHFELRKGSTPVDPLPHLAGL
mgnify:CR=1 FL=1